MINENKIIKTLEKSGVSCAVSGIKITGGKVSFVLEVDSARGVDIETLRQKAEKTVAELPGVKQVSVILTAKRKANPPQKTSPIKNLAPDIKYIIAVASGKGGVGKSTIAVNLAVALAQSGHNTGLLDADIYGPSAPTMLGLSEKPKMNGKKLEPLQAHGLKVMSMGFLVPEDKPMIWRGPMIQTALRQFLGDVNWGELDILVVDMPPGTGDAQLTMVQKVPLAGALIVSTPQDIALLDARKGLNMFRETGVPILGIIENMSTFICPECGHEEPVFGHGGAQNEAQKLGCHFLGALPLHRDIRETSDRGTPIIVAQPESEYAQIFKIMAEDIAQKLFRETKRAQEF